MQSRHLSWLVDRPIAHRGLHDLKHGRVENTESAFQAAITGNYAIECDLQITKDGEAVVFHDDEIDRLLRGKGAVKGFSFGELKSMQFQDGRDRVQSLHELLEQVDGKNTLVIEIKSHWDADFSLTERTLKVLESYQGPYALMSFDPDIVAHIAAKSENTIRGITADRVIDPYYDPLPEAKRASMRTMAHLPETRPHFVSFDFTQLPYEPVTKMKSAGYPIISWTIRNVEEAEEALQWCDQITFENFLP